MEVAIFFPAFFFIVLVLGPIFGAESRPDFIRPDRKSRFRMVVVEQALTPGEKPR